MLDSIRNAVTDKSWRVRYMVANEFVNLAESVGEAIVKEELVGAFVGLLKDQEAEVRTASASQVPGALLTLNGDCFGWVNDADGRLLYATGSRCHFGPNRPLCTGLVD
jgi:hypothetical protein